MDSIVNVTARLIRVAQRAFTRKWSFLAVFSLIFSASIVTLSSLDLLPNAPTPAAAVVPAVTLDTKTQPVPVAIEDPVKIEIPKINLLATIANPTTTDDAILNSELLRGAVRYPTSAKLGQVGNVVLFGHSSYLPIVGNPAYKTFNGIQKLAVGDVVTVYSSGTAYTYTVRTVAKESATDAGIPLDVTGRVLTLATCDSFGVKTDRFVVTADFVDSHSIST